MHVERVVTCPPFAPPLTFCSTWGHVRTNTRREARRERSCRAWAAERDDIRGYDVSVRLTEGCLDQTSSLSHLKTFTSDANIEETKPLTRNGCFNQQSLCEVFKGQNFKYTSWKHVKKRSCLHIWLFIFPGVWISNHSNVLLFESCERM